MPPKKMAENGEDIRYVWNGTSHQLAELVTQLKQRQFISRKKDLFDLFEMPYAELTIYWDAFRKPHLAYLLYRLFSEGYCQIRGSKGYFAYAEKHFFDSEGNSFPSDSLKKLSSKINKHPDKYSDVIRDVEDVLQNLGG